MSRLVQLFCSASNQHSQAMAIKKMNKVLYTATESIDTRFLPVDISKIRFIDADSTIDQIHIDFANDHGPDVTNLELAAEALRESDVPVAFPTETVYGLGAVATRSSAVKGIFKAKQRPADNPLIVHVASVQQLEELLHSEKVSDEQPQSLIPEIYKPLIERFWPGPLTIILENPSPSPIAPEVTAGLSTFGARMPQSRLARTLITLTGTPLAAPSANASGRPSPTAARHVMEDLKGRVRFIVDGGHCNVGLESTVVDGLSKPPQILRPGGISTSQIRACTGWEGVEIGYKDKAEGIDQPRAPGMKYKHYSPKAPVYLVKGKFRGLSLIKKVAHAKNINQIGIIRTKTWEPISNRIQVEPDSAGANDDYKIWGIPILDGPEITQSEAERDLSLGSSRKMEILMVKNFVIRDLFLGPSTKNIAQLLFSSLRRLDEDGVQAILVEALDETEDDLAGAVMNRLKKAAEYTIFADETFT